MSRGRAYSFFAAAALATQIYAWARVAHRPIHGISIADLHTAVWVASFWGILQLIKALF